MFLSYQHQQYLGEVGNNADSTEHQIADVNSIGMNLMYNPLDNVSIDAALNYEKRDSNDPLRSYETSSAGINLKVSF
jgi:hypothetical protein